MLNLCIGMIFLFIIALTLLAIPFFMNKTSLFSKAYLLLALFTITFPLVFYFAWGQIKPLHHWLTRGKNHYDLQVEVDRLGGINGMIARIEGKLKENPEDRKGWSILGKLYLVVGEEVKAEEAFKKAAE